jgi:hypothetical protein
VRNCTPHNGIKPSFGNNVSETRRKKRKMTSLIVTLIESHENIKSRVQRRLLYVLYVCRRKGSRQVQQKIAWVCNSLGRYVEGRTILKGNGFFENGKGKGKSRAIPL